MSMLRMSSTRIASRKQYPLYNARLERKVTGLLYDSRGVQGLANCVMASVVGTES